MRFFLLNTLAAGILIGIRILGPLWICRRTTLKKMKKLIVIVIVSVSIFSCTKVVNKPGPLVPHPAPYFDPTKTHYDTVVVDH